MLLMNEKKFNQQMLTTLLIFIFMQNTSANVNWKMKESLIVLGKPLNLVCTTSSTNITNVSRRWTGGPNNKVICFNGAISNLGKYQEIEESVNKFTLQIKETSEDDLNCPYSCRFGLQTDERILYVTEENFNYLQTENTTLIEYSLNKENYTLHLEFKKVFPEPVCKIQIKDTVRNLTKVKESKGRLFYHVTYHMESRDSLHSCGRDVEVKCIIGKKLHTINFSNDLSCSALVEDKSTSISNITITGTVLGLFVTVVICILAYFTYLKKLKSQKRDQGNTYTIPTTAN